MELCSLVDISPPDAVRERETTEARMLWTRLKRTWAAKPAWTSRAVSSNHWKSSRSSSHGTRPGTQW